MNKEFISKLKNFTLLYIEDEDGIRENIGTILKDMFKKVYLVANTQDAYSIFLSEKLDLIISDIRLKRDNGIDLIKRIRKDNTKIRIIITSAHTDLSYMLDATELNLVKYIVKPINQTKLNQALEAFLNTYKDNVIYKLANNYLFDEGKSQIINQKEVYKLTKKEHIFLKLLIKKNRIISYEEIQSLIWNENNVMSQNALRVFIKNFRKKLPKNSLNNIQGLGYRLLF